MLSKNKIKFFSSLHAKKNRLSSNAFFVEGAKLVSELLTSNYKIISIVATAEWIASNTIPKDCEWIEADISEISKISALTNPQEVWALASIPKQENGISIVENQLTLALDNIQDPGNLGTIIRLAEWFGISQIICSEDTVEAYNPKVVQASMGALFRVHVNYCNLLDFLQKQTDIPIYAADLEGNNVYTTQLPNSAILVMGNEGNGISAEVLKIAKNKLHIPTFNQSDSNSESLNVAIATAILCSEFKRRNL